MPTKRELILAAFEEIGLGSNVYSHDAADLQSALLRLNALMAQYAGSQAAAGWPQGTVLDAATDLPPQYERAVIAGLAVDIAPSHGRSPSPQTLAAAQQGRNLMLRDTVSVPLKQIDTMAVPAGQGHKKRYRTNLTTTDTVATPDERVS